MGVMIMFRRHLLVCTVTLLLASPCAMAQRGRNLLKNGGFEDWPKDAVQPPGWHTLLTSIIPIPEYKDPQNKQGRTGRVDFKDGCGYIWGTVRPWAGLFCPKCKHLNIGLEDAGDMYFDNHEYVRSARGKTGKKE